MKRILFVFTIASMFLISSCATIFTGTKDTITFTSSPSGANVYIDGVMVCTTPCNTKVKRSLSDKLAEIRLDGYETKVITLDRTFNAVSIINLTNFLFWGIDAATGSLMKYGKKGYDIKLDESSAGSAYIDKAHKIEIDTNEEVVNVYVKQ